MREYIIILSLAIAFAFIRAKHDSYLLEGGWKKWAFIEGLLIASALSTLLCPIWYLDIVLFFIYGLWFWLVFDMVIGFHFGGSIFYLGSGKFDTMVRKIFINGFLYALFKTMWLILVSGLYFAMIKS